MPIVDMTTHLCNWCKTSSNVYKCEYCHKYSCIECRQHVGEEGCIHHKRDTVTTQSWESKLPQPIERERETGCYCSHDTICNYCRAESARYYSNLNNPNYRKYDPNR